MILFGFKSCGKSYFGKLLAEQLKHKWIDTDTLVSQLYASQCQEIVSLRTLYQEKGPSFFRSLEEEVISSLTPSEATVISLGGGTLLSEKNRSHLSQFKPLIYLRACRSTLKRRIFSHPPPPFLFTSELFEFHYSIRSSIFKQYAHHCIDVEKGGALVLQTLLQWATNGK